MLKDYLQHISKEKFFFTLLLILLLFDRYITLTHFNFQFVGNDDTILWQAATDYSQGIFHEPYFYGQNYNFMLEAIMAIPFIKLGLSHHYALPLVTAFLSLFPFLLFSIILFKRAEHFSALVFLAIPLCLPFEYGMLASMPRGFIQGLFFTSFFIFPLLEPHKKSSWIICCIAFGAGYFSNPNSLIVAFPVCIFLLVKNFKNLWFYLISLITVIPFFVAEYFAKEFYNINTAYNVHPLMSINFDVIRMLQNFNNLSDFFSFFTPVIWFKGWLILPIIFLFGLFLFKKEKLKAICILLTVIYIFITLGISKVNDSIHHILLTSARMYLGIPIFTGIALFWAKPLFVLIEKKLITIIFLVSVTCFCLKSGLIQPAVTLNTIKSNHGCVAVHQIDSLKIECFKIKCIVDYYNVDLVVFVPNWIQNAADMQIYNGSCNLLIKNFPPNVISGHEKRTWIFWEEKTKVRKTILLYGRYLEEWQLKKLKNCLVVSRDPYILLVKNNTLPLDSLLKLYEIEYKRN